MSTTSQILDSLFTNISDAVVVADGNRQLVRVNRAFEVLTGHHGEGFLTANSGNAGIAHLLLQQAMTSGDGENWIGAIRCADGSDRRFEVRVVKVDNQGHGHSHHYLGLVLPCEEDPLTGEERRFGIDALTSLPNRDIFLDRVEQSILHTSRGGGSVALLMMGLDRFTLVNDALGHIAGNRLLTQVAQRLKRCIRETDTAVRLEGDKFALVMGIADMDDSVIVAEKVLSAIHEPFLIDQQEVVVTFSIGIALYPQDATTGHQLIKHAENALHHAKITGRNQYQFYSTDMNFKAKARLDLESRLRRALANGEFLTYYQPKVSATDDTIVGAEALVRWQDPDRGIVSPCDFIPVAEETGLIEQIGTWILRDTCLQNKKWQKLGLQPLRISVNVSARQFRNPGFVATVSAILDETGLSAEWLDLEITESMLMNDVDDAVLRMTALRDMGIGLSIDDFGTGYSSLSYLGRFPITTLKIDRAFITDVDTNPKTAEIARAIIGLSKGLNLEVVAEGCEIASHVAFLQAHGCHTVQGYYYSRPVPAAEFEQMLRAHVMTRGN
jgi:diguanylate cyclase